MARVKRMNESVFAKLHKSITTTGELIRARQEEKQGLLNEFDQEAKRFFFGRISEKSLASSVKKTNKELQRLDANIRENITNLRKLCDHVAKMASAQAPLAFKATLSGLTGGNLKKSKNKKAKKKTKKATKKKTKKAPKKKTSKRKKK